MSESKQKPKNEEGALQQTLKAFGILGGLGFFFAAVLGICIFLGDLADSHLGTGYYGKLIGIIFGFPIAIYTTYRQLKSIR